MNIPKDNLLCSYRSTDYFYIASLSFEKLFLAFWYIFQGYRIGNQWSSMNANSRFPIYIAPIHHVWVVWEDIENEFYDPPHLAKEFPDFAKVFKIIFGCLCISMTEIFQTLFGHFVKSWCISSWTKLLLSGRLYSLSVRPSHASFGPLLSLSLVAHV